MRLILFVYSILPLSGEGLDPGGLLETPNENNIRGFPSLVSVGLSTSQKMEKPSQDPIGGFANRLSSHCGTCISLDVCRLLAVEDLRC